MTRLSRLIGAAVLACAFSAPAQAAPVLGQTLIATGGDVVVTFMSNGAGYTNELYLDGPIGDDFGAIFNNWTTATGTSLNLGTFLTGTELIFRIAVANTGNVFYTGAGVRNADGIAHAAVDSRLDQVLVGFEDLFGGGDRDYNDLMLSFANVSVGEESDPSGTPVMAVDEPATLVLFGSGLAALLLIMRRQSIRR